MICCSLSYLLEDIGMLVNHYDTIFTFRAIYQYNNITSNIIIIIYGVVVVSKPTEILYILYTFYLIQLVVISSILRVRLFKMMLGISPLARYLQLIKIIQNMIHLIYYLENLGRVQRGLDDAPCHIIFRYIIKINVIRLD